MKQNNNKNPSLLVLKNYQPENLVKTLFFPYLEHLYQSICIFALSLLDFQFGAIFMLQLSCWLLIISLKDICLASEGDLRYCPKKKLQRKNSQIHLQKYSCTTPCHYDQMARQLQNIWK